MAKKTTGSLAAGDNPIGKTAYDYGPFVLKTPKRDFEERNPGKTYVAPNPFGDDSNEERDRNAAIKQYRDYLVYQTDEEGRTLQNYGTRGDRD